MMKNKKLLKIISAVLVVVIACTSVYFAATEGKRSKEKSLFQQVLDDHGFVYGINYAWASLGDRQPVGKTLTFNEKLFDDGIYNLKQIGLDAAQLWFFAQGEGIEFDPNGDVLGLQDKFVTNVRKVCEIARKYEFYIAFTIQPHFDYNLESALYSGSKEIYDKYTRMITDPTVREHYIERAVKPVLEILADYPDIVFGITAYCEPEGDIYGKPNGYKPWGTTQQVMSDFITAIVDASKEILPNVPTSIASGWDFSDSIQFFNRTGADILGMDIYDNNGNVKNPRDLILTAPAMLTEFGPTGDGANSTNAFFHATNYQNFIANSKISGYVGAFYWMYSGQGTMLSILGSSAYDYLPITSTIHYTIVDDKNVQAGIDDAKDVPVMLSPDVDGTLKFIASRNAESYKFVRTKDGKTFEDAGSIAADAADKNGGLICSYMDTTAEQGVSYQYKIISVEYDGTEVESELSRAVKTMQTTCSESENYYPDHSFENASDLKTYFERYHDTNGKHFSFVTDGTAGDTVHTGTKALKLVGNNDWSWVGRRFKVKPNTKYVLTFHYRSDGDKNAQFKVLDPNNGLYSYKKVNMSTAYPGQWIRNTSVVTIGDTDELVIAVADTGGTFTVDDIYFFEYTEE